MTGQSPLGEDLELRSKAVRRDCSSTCFCWACRGDPNMSGENQPPRYTRKAVVEGTEIPLSGILIPFCADRTVVRLNPSTAYLETFCDY